jgi:hypothetical protein
MGSGTWVPDLKVPESWASYLHRPAAPYLKPVTITAPIHETNRFSRRLSRHRSALWVCLAQDTPDAGLVLRFYHSSSLAELGVFLAHPCRISTHTNWRYYA